MKEEKMAFFCKEGYDDVVVIDADVVVINVKGMWYRRKERKLRKARSYL